MKHVTGKRDRQMVGRFPEGKSTQLGLANYVDGHDTVGYRILYFCSGRVYGVTLEELNRARKDLAALLRGRGRPGQIDKAL